MNVEDLMRKGVVRGEVVGIIGEHDDSQKIRGVLGAVVKEANVLVSYADGEHGYVKPDELKRVDPVKLATALHGLAIRTEDMSRGSHSDSAAQNALSAIHLETSKMLAVLQRPDLLVDL